MLEYYYQRNPAAVMVIRDRECIFMLPDQSPVVVRGDVCAGMPTLMQISSSPVSEGEMAKLVNGETRDLLINSGILMRAPLPVLVMSRTRAKPAQKRCRHLVLGLTGAIVSLRVVSLVLDLQARFAEHVDVILTGGALQLLQPQALAYLGVGVWTDQSPPSVEINVPHIYLGKVADIVAVVPASAHTLHKLAHGACNDLLSLTISATTAPVVLFPAMNGVMWNHKAIARNIAQLTQDGYYIVEPQTGGEVSHHEGSKSGYGNAGFGEFDLADLLGRIMHKHSSVVGCGK